jgi:putative membrane protein (TIGR04086 family)
MGGGAAFVGSLLVLAAAAAAISAGALTEELSTAAALCAVAVGSLVGGLFSGLRAGGYMLPVGGGVGLLCGLCWMVAALLSGGAPIGQGIFRTFCAALAGGCLAGFLCPKPKKRRK